MAISYLIKINNTDITEYLKSYDVSYEEMWEEANRNMRGVNKAVYVGTAIKLYLQFRQLTKEEMSTVIGLCKKSFTVSWYDEDTDTHKSDQFYRGEMKIGIRDLHSEMYKELSMNLISFGTLETSA